MTNDHTASAGLGYARLVERAAKQALASLDAVFHGGLLDAAPPEQADIDRQAVGVELLYGAHALLKRALADDQGETALSSLIHQLPDAFGAAVARVDAIGALLAEAHDDDVVASLADAETDAVESLLEVPARSLKDVLLKIERFRKIGSFGEKRDAENLALITRDIERFDRIAA